MTQPQPIRPKGASRYDLLAMSDEDFETMVARLVRLEFEKAFKPSNTKDGGADMVLPRGGGGYERCWQAKHFTRNVKWDQCEKSLKAALENWPGISKYTFVFPRELTNPEQKTFDRKFHGADATIDVNYWEGDRLQDRLAGSDAGRRIAKTFFDDVELDRENVYRAIEVGGRLDSVEDALDRLGNVGGFLASKDAFFSYPAATHEADEMGPPLTPGTVMSVGETEGSITRRVDIVPRDEEAMERYAPQFQLAATEGEAGQRAAEKLQEALREGKEVEIAEGLDVTFTRLPPALNGLVGKKLTGAVQFGRLKRVRPRAAPFRARLEVSGDRGTAAVELVLRQADTVPNGWDDAFVGRYGGMTVTELGRQVGNGGEIRWDLRHRRDSSPAREQLAALRFLAASWGGGALTFTRLGGPDPPSLTSPIEPTPADADAEALLAFLEDVCVIEEWADVVYELPETVGVDERRGVLQVASIIRAGGMSGTWDNAEFNVDDEGVRRLRDGGPLRVEREARAAVLGRVVDLGFTRLDIPSYTVTSVQPAADEPGRFTVRIAPPDEEASKVFEHLVKSPTKARRGHRPPPPPPRKRKRRRGGRKRR